MSECVGVCAGEGGGGAQCYRTRGQEVSVLQNQQIICFPMQGHLLLYSICPTQKAHLLLLSDFNWETPTPTHMQGKVLLMLFVNTRE